MNAPLGLRAPRPPAGSLLRAIRTRAGSGERWQGLSRAAGNANGCGERTAFGARGYPGYQEMDLLRDHWIPASGGKGVRQVFTLHVGFRFKASPRKGSLGRSPHGSQQANASATRCAEMEHGRDLLDRQRGLLAQANRYFQLGRVALSLGSQRGFLPTQSAQLLDEDAPGLRLDEFRSDPSPVRPTRGWLCATWRRGSGTGSPTA